MSEQEDDFLRKLKDENTSLRETNSQVNGAISAYQGQEDANLIQYQIDTGDMLSKIEHFLRGEYISTDKEGNEFWARPTIMNEKEETVIDEKLILFNDYGVNAIMSIIGNYIDKNTILSRYDELRINEILADLGDELANFIYCNYETMGMNDNFKKTRFQLTVITILHSIESTYRRALGGKTMEDLNSSRIFTQSDHIGSGQRTAPIKKNFNPFSPKTW